MCLKNILTQHGDLCSIDTDVGSQIDTLPHREALQLPALWPRVPPQADTKEESREDRDLQVLPKTYRAYLKCDKPLCQEKERNGFVESWGGQSVRWAGRGGYGEAKIAKMRGSKVSIVGTLKSI